MPEPSLYLQAMGAAAIVSALCVLVLAGVRRPASAARLNSACVLGIGLGLVVGHHVLNWRWAWPPVHGLDRFLTIVIPGVLGIEMIAGFQCVPRWVAWCLRMGLAATTPRILLHGSVYLSGSGSDWTLWQAETGLAVCGALLAGLWGLLGRLFERSPGVSIPLALCLTTQCAGLTVMMAGYIKGGAAAFPLAAALLATVLGARLTAPRSGVPAILGIGVVGLFGLLFIGRFFGRLPTNSALAMLIAPLLCWATEAPLLRHRKPWFVGSLRLALVAIPLVVVLAVAKHNFDRDMAPLLGKDLAPTFYLQRRHRTELAMVRCRSADGNVFPEQPDTNRVIMPGVGIRAATFQYSGAAPMTLRIAVKSARLFACVLAVACCLPATESKPDEPGKAATSAADAMLGKEAGQIRDDNSLTMKLIWCPPGFFKMENVELAVTEPAGNKNGDTPNDDDFDQVDPKDEPEPQRVERITPVKVFLTKGYWLGKYEVTQSEWKRVMETEPWKGQEFTKEGDDFPATYISWDNAMAFCRKLTELECEAGRLTVDWEYTLPSEAQWERACRARTGTRFSFEGDESKLGRYAWFRENAWDARERYAHRVGQRKPNPWGLHDMHGNAWEWCRDWYQPKLPEGRDPEVKSAEKTEGSVRVRRGGSWSIDSSLCQSGSRSRFSPDARDGSVGFRVALCASGKSGEGSLERGPAATRR